MLPPPVCLSIAGSDPSGGAGIQGDLKTFAAHRVYGMAVITALTAQNTRTVSGVRAVDPEFVTEQLDRVFDDIPTRWVKTGMLLNEAIIKAVARFFVVRPDVKLVIDPVMVSSSGAQLLEPAAVQAYTDDLFPIAAVITPNNHETKLLTGISVSSVDDAITASLKLREMGADSVLVKGGDTVFKEDSAKLFDVLNHQGRIHVFERELVGSRNSHGTGCAMASAICSNMAWGRGLSESVDLAGRYVGGALKEAYATGQGSGSINHLWNGNPSINNR